jgi:hypothetical protein
MKMAEVGGKVAVEHTAPGGGARSSDAEYVLPSNIEPRMYLAARPIIDFSQGRIETE